MSEEGDQHKYRYSICILTQEKCPRPVERGCNRCPRYYAENERIGEIEAGKKLREELIERLIRTKRMADGGDVCISNQGQALDGYSELAEYRSIISDLNPKKKLHPDQDLEPSCWECGGKMEHTLELHKDEFGGLLGPKDANDGCIHWYCKKCNTWNFPAYCDPSDYCPVCFPESDQSYSELIHEGE